MKGKRHPEIVFKLISTPKLARQPVKSGIKIELHSHTQPTREEKYVWEKRPVNFISFDETVTAVVKKAAHPIPCLDAD